MGRHRERNAGFALRALRHYGDRIGICLAVSIVTLRKMSSDDLPDGAFPLVCESCGHRAVVPSAEGTTLDEHELRLAVRCVVCSSRRLTRARHTLIALRLKMDRRATPGQLRNPERRFTP